MNAETFIDMAQAHLGGLGPDANSLSISDDILAQLYPFNALAGKPLNLTEPQPKEAFRTYWRLTTLSQQFNSKALFFKR